MLWITIAVLFLIWLVGAASSFMLGGFIHVFFIAAAMLASVSALRHRNPL